MLSEESLVRRAHSLHSYVYPALGARILKCAWLKIEPEIRYCARRERVDFDDRLPDEFVVASGICNGD